CRLWSEWCVTPIHVAFVRHGFVHERVEVGVVAFEGFACGDRPVGVIGRTALAGGIEVSINTRGPVLDTVACGRRAFPATPARGSLEDFLQSLIELDIETFDAHFVLLDGKAAIIPI